MNTRYVGFGFIFIALVIVAVVLYKNSPQSQIPIIFSETEFLQNTWQSYKNEYIEKSSGRTIDKQQNNITTSEGQSYTMMRAVWMGDKETFDRSFVWTKENLGRKDDHLFSWLFGQENGKYVVLTSQGGSNTATDADSDIALSLIFAYSRWKEPSYLLEAQKIISDIWEHEVIMVQGKPYLVANNLEQFSDDQAIINPSYLSPYAYKIFSKIDKKHPWIMLSDTSYDIINTSMESTLDKQKSVKIPPDWVVINKKTGEINSTKVPHLTTNYSFDAMRTPWRLALDWQWFRDQRSKNILDKMVFLQQEWTTKRNIYSTYTHDGQVVYRNEAPSVYGGSLGYFVVSNPEEAENVYNHKLKILYNPDAKTWKNKLSYYDDNWAWLGTALYFELLPNLSESITQEEIDTILTKSITH